MEIRGDGKKTIGRANGFGRIGFGGGPRIN
jgi:hypothetical protein